MFTCLQFLLSKNNYYLFNGLLVQLIHFVIYYYMVCDHVSDIARLFLEIDYIILLLKITQVQYMDHAALAAHNYINFSIINNNSDK